MLGFGGSALAAQLWRLSFGGSALAARLAAVRYPSAGCRLPFTVYRLPFTASHKGAESLKRLEKA